jgi:hypothetical protein
MYLRYTIESYDGMAVVRTVDPAAAIIELLIAPGCESQLADLLEHLRMKENVMISPTDSAEADFL